jgi:SH3-like domain-containing protein
MKKTVLLSLAFFLSASSASAAEDAEATRLPLPRFASLRSNEVNMRTGPGLRYPIEWVYKRKGLPVEITAEYDIWRRVRDPRGTEGWISKVELTGRRHAVVQGGSRELRRRSDDDSAVVAHVEEGAVGQITSCERVWCKVKFDGAKGFLRKEHFWGAYPEEVFD